MNFVSDIFKEFLSRTSPIESDESDSDLPDLDKLQFTSRGPCGSSLKRRMDTLNVSCSKQARQQKCLILVEAAFLPLIVVSVDRKQTVKYLKVP